jgi:hypothetical protein
MQARARKLSPRIVEGIQATKSAISSGTTSGWGSSLALQELSGAIIGGTDRFGGFDAMEATRATQPRPVNTNLGSLWPPPLETKWRRLILNPQPLCCSQPRRCRSARSRASRPLPVRLQGMQTRPRSRQSTASCKAVLGLQPTGCFSVTLSIPSALLISVEAARPRSISQTTFGMH